MVTSKAGPLAMSRPLARRRAPPIEHAYGREGNDHDDKDAQPEHEGAVPDP